MRKKRLHSSHPCVSLFGDDLSRKDGCKVAGWVLGELNRGSSTSTVGRRVAVFHTRLLPRTFATEASTSLHCINCLDVVLFLLSLSLPRQPGPVGLVHQDRHCFFTH